MMNGGQRGIQQPRGIPCVFSNQMSGNFFGIFLLEIASHKELDSFVCIQLERKNLRSTTAERNPVYEVCIGNGGQVCGIQPVESVCFFSVLK
jgi:hypothetical protein